MVRCGLVVHRRMHHLCPDFPPEGQLVTERVDVELGLVLVVEGAQGLYSIFILCIQALIHIE